MKPVKRPFEEKDEAKGDEGAGKMIRRRDSLCEEGDEGIDCVRRGMKGGVGVARVAAIRPSLALAGPRLE